MDVVELFLERYNYWSFVILMLIGLYGAIVYNNLVKKIIGLSIFQTAIFLLFISMADVGRDIERTLGLKSGTAPIVWEKGIEHGYMYVNPVPHVLVLTGIVVSAATLALALALMIRIYKEFGTLDEEELREMVE
ncbi:sodium:proton antiporter [Geoglobus sp.]